MMEEYVLTVDIGNTNISLGIFESGRLLRHLKLPSKQPFFACDLKRFTKALPVKKGIVCSVVPAVTRRLVSDFKRVFFFSPCVLGKKIPVPLINKYRKPSEVGQDRLVNGFAGASLFGTPVIVVDFGTAVTFDVVSRKKEYKGGMILPGLRISLEALANKTALLPRIQLAIPKELIGTDTKSSMLSGLVYGFAALTDDLISRIKNKIGADAKAVATGGDAPMIVKFCKNVDAVDTHLTLKGLYLIAKTL